MSPHTPRPPGVIVHRNSICADTLVLPPHADAHTATSCKQSGTEVLPDASCVTNGNLMISGLVAEAERGRKRRLRGVFWMTLPDMQSWK